MARNAQRLDELELRLVRIVQNRLGHARLALENRSARLRQQTPATKIKTLAFQQQHLYRRLTSALALRLERLNQRLLKTSQTLHTVSPLATLNRGYALVTDPDSGLIIRSTEQLSKGDIILTRLAQGRFTSQIETISHD